MLCISYLLRNSRLVNHKKAAWHIFLFLQISAGQIVVQFGLGQALRKKVSAAAIGEVSQYISLGTPCYKLVKAPANTNPLRNQDVWIIAFPHHECRLKFDLWLLAGFRPCLPSGHFWEFATVSFISLILINSRELLKYSLCGESTYQGYCPNAGNTDQHLETTCKVWWLWWWWW